MSKSNDVERVLLIKPYDCEVFGYELTKHENGQIFVCGCDKTELNLHDELVELNKEEISQLRWEYIKAVLKGRRKVTLSIRRHPTKSQVKELKSLFWQCFPRKIGIISGSRIKSNIDQKIYSSDLNSVIKSPFNPNVPLILDLIFCLIENLHFEREGLYRKNPNIQLRNNILEKLKETVHFEDLKALETAWNDPVMLSSIAKNFLRNLNPRLISDDLKTKLENALGKFDENHLRDSFVRMHGVLQSLYSADEIAFSTLQLICRHIGLLAHVHSDEHQRMNLSSLVQLFATNIYPEQQKLPTTVPTSTKSETVLRILSVKSKELFEGKGTFSDQSLDINPIHLEPTSDSEIENVVPVELRTKQIVCRFFDCADGKRNKYDANDNILNELEGPSELHKMVIKHLGLTPMEHITI